MVPSFEERPRASGFERRECSGCRAGTGASRRSTLSSRPFSLRSTFTGSNDDRFRDLLFGHPLASDFSFFADLS